MRSMEEAEVRARRVAPTSRGATAQPPMAAASRAAASISPWPRGAAHCTLTSPTTTSRPAQGGTSRRATRTSWRESGGT
eukprot:5048487-Alexandrium_andersonii.AAC.1